MELALLTKLSDQACEKDFATLKKEIELFKKYFDEFSISYESIRIHQPGGYTYFWANQNFDFLKKFFDNCQNQGFQHFVVHAPYGDTSIDQQSELSNFRKNNSTIGQELEFGNNIIHSSDANIIITSNGDFSGHSSGGDGSPGNPWIALI